MNWLAEVGFPPEGVDEALARAITLGETRAAADAVADGADVNYVSNNGRSVLMEAVMQRRAEICQILLDAGADPHTCDQWGETMLHRAAFSGNARICEMLVTRGADPCFMPADVDAFVRDNAECSEGIGYLTPLQKAVHGRKPDAMFYLFSVSGTSPYQTTLSGKSMDELVEGHEPAMKVLRSLQMEWDIRQAVDEQAIGREGSLSRRGQSATLL